MVYLWVFQENKCMNVTRKRTKKSIPDRYKNLLSSVYCHRFHRDLRDEARSQAPNSLLVREIHARSPL